MKLPFRQRNGKKNVNLKRTVHKIHKCIAEPKDDLLPTFIFTSHKSPRENLTKNRVYLKVSTPLKLNNLAAMIFCK